MVVRAFGSLLAVPVHVVPAKLTDYMFVLAEFPLKAKTHVKVWTAFVDVSVGTMIAFVTSLLHKFRADLQIMAEIALVTVAAGTQGLEFITGFDLALVMGVGTVVTESTFSVDELFADSIGGEFVVVGRGHFGVVGGRSFVLYVELSIHIGLLVGIDVHNQLYTLQS